MKIINVPKSMIKRRGDSRCDAVRYKSTPSALFQWLPHALCSGESETFYLTLTNALRNGEYRLWLDTAYTICTHEPTSPHFFLSHIHHSEDLQSKTAHKMRNNIGKYVDSYGLSQPSSSNGQSGTNWNIASSEGGRISRVLLRSLQGDTTLLGFLL